MGKICNKNATGEASKRAAAWKEETKKRTFLPLESAT